MNIRDFNKILIVRGDSIGDQVMMSAFVRELRHNCPAAYIKYLMPKASLPLYAKNPHLNSTDEYVYDHAYIEAKLSPNNSKS